MNSLQPSLDSDHGFHVLHQPQVILYTVLESTQSTQFYFTVDLDRRFVCMSQTFDRLCRIPPNSLLGRPLDSLLTDHARNEPLRAFKEASDDANDAPIVYCEIQNEQAQKIKLELCWRSVRFQGRQIGFIAIGRCLKHFPLISDPLNPVTDPFLKLNTGELQVTQRVIDGKMNRNIAIKLRVAVRTVESRRAKAMDKLGVTNLADLVKLWC